MSITRKLSMALAVVVLSLSYQAPASAGPKVMVYKDAACGCCNGYIAYLRAHGINAVGKNVANTDVLKRTLRVPDDLESCHSVVIEGYVVEGHVPVAAITRMLVERPEIIGISLPGMLLGSPGMNGKKDEAFEIISFSKSGQKLFMRD